MLSTLRLRVRRTVWGLASGRTSITAVPSRTIASSTNQSSPPARARVSLLGRAKSSACLARMASVWAVAVQEAPSAPIRDADQV